MQGVPDLSEYGDAYDLEFGLGVNQPPTSAIIKKELQRKILYQMSPPEVWKVYYITKLYIIYLTNRKYEPLNISWSPKKLKN